MSETKVYPKGVRIFNPHEKAPKFVKGSMVITMNELFKFCKENEALLTEYKGEKQLKLQILEGDKGLQVVVDTYRKDSEKTVAQETGEELPF